MMEVLNVRVDHKGIHGRIDGPWCFVLGRKRSALFLAESDSERDEWVQFITDRQKLEGRCIESIPLSIPFAHR